MFYPHPHNVVAVGFNRDADAVIEVTTVQNDPCIAGIHCHVALSDRREGFACDEYSGRIVDRKQGRIEIDHTSSNRIEQRLPQRAGAAVGRAGDGNGRIRYCTDLIAEFALVSCGIHC